MPEINEVKPKRTLNERAKHLLKALIEHYIREGQPVGSRTLARVTGMELGPATIRNVMADLEDMGFVRSPHTSAGRIPTVPGYRFFVDSLLTVKALERSVIEDLRAQLDPDKDLQALVESASALLSDVTRMAGLVTMPKREQISLRQVEFLPLSDRRVLAILVINEREVQNRVIHTNRHYSVSELQQAANYLNAQISGRDLISTRNALLQEMRDVRETMNTMMLAAVEIAEKAFSDSADGGNYVLAGQTHLMEFAELSDVGKLRQLFEAFNHKRDILHLLDQCLSAQGVQVFIGEESGYDVLDECSVVTAPYAVDGKVLGVLGVIGPTRMDYERVIPIVDVTARLLGAALNPRN